jgi:uncharacterized protein (TIGR00661 family)
MNLTGKPRVLVAPLDWGLGHATRCIPLISGLIKQGYVVMVAAEGRTKLLLEQEFPTLEYLPLKGYSISYTKTRVGLFFSMIRQMPKILSSIRAENEWLKKTVKKYGIDIIISDNRYGLFNKEIHSVFLTHQLLIKTPVFQKRLQKLNFYFINKFDECWVPDFNGEPNLAGILSHPKKMPAIPVRYIGWLSRFEKAEQKEEKHLLILLSGPEPQRTILENKILKQLENFSQPVLMIRGLPGDISSIQVPPNVKFVNHLPAKELKEAIHNSSFVIARSGYSTIMDLLKLKKKSILIPTPGQTEQEYLARHLLEKQLAFCAQQQTFDLNKALVAASTFPYSFLDRNATSSLEEALVFDKYLNRKAK